MSYLTKIAFELNTDIIGDNTKNMSDLYKTETKLVDGNNVPAYVSWAQTLCSSWGKSEEEFDKIQFKDFSVSMIDEFINVQLSGGVSAPSDLSFEEVTMLSDIKAWVMERRANDINSAWLWKQEEEYDKYMRDVGHDIKIADYAIDRITSTAYFVIDKIFEYSDKTYISKDDFKVVENTIDRDGLVLGDNSVVTVHYIKELGVDTWNALRAIDTEKRIAYYEFLVSSEINFGTEAKPRKVSVKYKGTAAKGERRKAMADGLIAEYKALIGGPGSFIGGVALDLLVKSNPWPVVSDLMNNIKDLDFERRENDKAREDAKKEKTMRGFNRAADCTGMVATVQKSALAYTKAGYSLTADGIKKFEPINE